MLWSFSHVAICKTLTFMFFPEPNIYSLVHNYGMVSAKDQSDLPSNGFRLSATWVHRDTCDQRWATPCHGKPSSIRYLCPKWHICKWCLYISTYTRPKVSYCVDTLIWYSFFSSTISMSGEILLFWSEVSCVYWHRKGKSTYLRQIGVMTVMALCGSLYVTSCQIAVPL